MPSYLQLTKFIEKGELSELEEQGIIKAFEYIYELAWNVIKDYYEEQGEGQSRFLTFSLSAWINCRCRQLDDDD